MTLTPILSDAPTRRAEIHQKAIAGVQSIFPLKVGKYTLETNNLVVKPKDYSSREQKDALLAGQTLQEPLHGDIVLRNEEGKIVDTKRNAVLAQLPFFTQRHTFIVDGNEYSVSNQRRVRPGVYTRVRGNEELEAAFNLAKGDNFRINMDPAKGHLFLQYGTSNIPLYPVLKHLGVSDSEMTKHWGAGVVEQNREHFKKKEEDAVHKLYERLVPGFAQTAKTFNEKIDAIHAAYKQTKLDPDVTERTLGTPFDRVTPLTMLKASQKLLDVHRQGVDTDDRDSLAFQTLHTVDDFIKERIKLEGRNLARKVRTKMTQTGSNAPTIDRLMPTSPFSKTLRSFITTSNLSAIPTQINPIEIISHATRITSLGEGGIGSERAVPPEARSLHYTHLGVIDPAATPESFRAGIDLRAALWTKRDEQGKMYTLLRNAKTGKLEDVAIDKLENAMIAFPGSTDKKAVSVLHNGELKSVPHAKVDYELPHASFMFSPSTNMLPMPESMDGRRITMGTRMVTQALPLIHREAPLVQVGSYNPGRTFEQELAALSVPTAPVDGVIHHVDKDYIYLRPQQRKTGSIASDWIPLVEVHEVLIEETKEAAATPLIKIPYDTRFPLASKTYLDNTVTVHKGDHVERGQPLADSNFTRDGRMALGTNLRVAYMPYYGLNSNDAVVVSEAATKKLTSEHMYKEVLPVDGDTILSKSKHRIQFGSRWTAAQYANLDERGVAKVGVKVQPGDPLIVALRKTVPTAEQKMLGNLHKSFRTPYREEVITWDHRCEGEVTDVVVNAGRALVAVKTQEPAGIGDKLCGRYGNKGVIAHIVPDDHMVRTKDGKVVDVIMTSAGIVSRINPAQVIETAVSKVAEKTGKPVVIQSMSGQNNVKWARDLLKEHGLSDKEVLYNPLTEKHIEGPDGKGVMVGPQYIYKLFKSTETNYSARGVEDYDVNLQPAKGGATGAKALGRMEVNALLAHNARNTLQEASVLKSSKNDEWWRRYQLGLPQAPPRTAFAYNKFTDMLRGAGVKVDKSQDSLLLGPMTDKDISKLSSGAVTKATMVREKDLTPEKGGLFDPTLTGGLSGNRWTHIDLAEPIVNPTFEKAVRLLLGLSQKEFHSTLRDGGGAAIQKQLKNIDLGKREKEQLELTRTATGAKLDDAVKHLKVVRALQAANLQPHEAYIISKIPVVPPVVRPILPARGKRDMLVSDANYMYRDAFIANDHLNMAKGVLPPEEVAKARAHLYDATKAIFGLGDPVSPQLQGRGAKGYITTISGEGSPKSGFFHDKVLKRPQDVSGRGTVAPDLTLNMDQVGLPEAMLWQMYQPFLVHGLIQQGYGAVTAKDMVEKQHPAARAVLLREAASRPVMINRAPTLHRFSIVGAYPVPVEGKTIRVNPFLEKGMNMDYDGDTLMVHTPVTDAAIKDVKSMTMSNLLFGDKGKSELMVFPQHEAIIGVHLGSKAEGTAVKRFKTEKDAIAAYQRGDIKSTDTISVG